MIFMKRSVVVLTAVLLMAGTMKSNAADEETLVFTVTKGSGANWIGNLWKNSEAQEFKIRLVKGASGSDEVHTLSPAGEPQETRVSQVRPQSCSLTRGQTFSRRNETGSLQVVHDVQVEVGNFDRWNNKNRVQRVTSKRVPKCEDAKKTSPGMQCDRNDFAYVLGLGASSEETVDETLPVHDLLSLIYAGRKCDLERIRDVFFMEGRSGMKNTLARTGDLEADLSGLPGATLNMLGLDRNSAKAVMASRYVLFYNNAEMLEIQVLKTQKIPVRARMYADGNKKIAIDLMLSNFVKTD